MTHAALHPVRLPHLFSAAVVALTVLVLGLTPAPVQAYDSYQHGPIEDCETCHESAHTDRTPLSFVCLTCHPGYQIVRAGDVCWTCHSPGQDMSWARSNASCLSACHLRNGVEFTHTGHPGGSSACTSCHPLTRSAAESAGSTHHTVPVPRLDRVDPSAAAPGASVTITGAKLSWATLVRIAGVSARYTIVSDGLIRATVPQAAVSGPVTVHSPGGVATSAAAFVVLRPEPSQPPAVTLAASRSVLELGRRVRLTGRFTPAGSGAQVRVVVRRRVAGVWKVAASSLRAVDAAGAYTWSYRPRSTGAFRARASAATAASARVTFRVR